VWLSAFFWRSAMIVDTDSKTIHSVHVRPVCEVMDVDRGMCCVVVKEGRQSTCGDRNEKEG